MSSANPGLELLSLPQEILLDFVQFLDVKSLLTLRQVCRLSRDIVDGSPQCQYELDLVGAGLEDGPSRAMSVFDRHAALKQYMNGWDNLKWTGSSLVKMNRGGLWELFGGVLAQNSPSKSFTFTRLPGLSRGIQEKTWTADKRSFKVRDFGMDPAQDLWVVIEKPKQSQNGMFQTTNLVHQIHLLSLERTPGTPHPLAKGGHILSLTQDFIDPELSFTIQISNDYLGIMAHTAHAGQNEFIVWNWKTGERKMELIGDEMRSFSFLSERHVLLTVLNHDGTENGQFRVQDIAPTLAIVDFTQTHRPQHITRTKAITLWYPPLSDNVTMVSFEIRSDPAPLWQPDPSSNVPFHLAPKNRVYVVSIWVVAEGENIPRLLVLFVPSRTLTSMINNYEEELKSSDGVYVTWANWGPDGTRMIMSPVPHSGAWVCYVHGTRYVALEAHQRGMEKVWCRVYDFNDLPIRRGQTEVDQENVIAEDQEISAQICDTVVYQVGPMTIKGGRIFQDDVTTSLPFRWKSVELDILASERNCAIMCSEDNIIVVDVSADCSTLARTLD
ncbi:hypothetical protein NMY22_g566 [Coprinellus aureogranulatus]|nr:hypothetical protein NMY22_g566 [Coprinellus aureogranulatus]